MNLNIILNNLCQTLGVVILMYSVLILLFYFFKKTTWLKAIKSDDCTIGIGFVSLIGGAFFTIASIPATGEENNLTFGAVILFMVIVCCIIAGIIYGLYKIHQMIPRT